MFSNKPSISKVKLLNDWISIDKCKPPKNIDILVWAREESNLEYKYYIASSDSYYGKIMAQDETIILEASHWMPIRGMTNSLDSIIECDLKKDVYFLTIGYLKKYPYCSGYMISRYNGKGEFVSSHHSEDIVEGTIINDMIMGEVIEETVFASLWKKLEPPKTNRFLILEKNSGKKFYQESLRHMYNNTKVV